MNPNPKPALTRLAVWWLRRQWTGQPPADEFGIPWIDASGKRRLVIGPGVIEPPGLLIDFDPQEPHAKGQALTTVGRIGITSYLLGWEAYPDPSPIGKGPR